MMASEHKANRRELVGVASMLFMGACATSPEQSAGVTPGLPGDYDEQSILARIARREAPYAALFEDEAVMAFLGDRPAARGHFLVMAKHVQARNFLELSSPMITRIVEAAQRVARAEIVALGAEGFTLRQNNGSASTIHRFHLHVIPRWRGDQLPEGRQPEVNMEELDGLAAQIRMHVV